MSQNKEYTNSPEAIKLANGETPLISKIKLGTKNFDITSPKDWSENRPAHRAYIYGRTHYEDSEVFFSEQDLEDENLVCTYSFSNSYLDGQRIITDTWQPTAEWFTPGKSYVVVFKYDLESESCEFKWNLAADPEYSFTYNEREHKLIYDPELNFISVINEQILSSTGNSTSRGNTLTLRPVIWDEKAEDSSLTRESNKENAQYTIIKKLDSKYISIDNKTIKQNSQGVLHTDEFFTSDFMISQDFGKYKARSLIPARGKTLTQVIQDAFCENLQPEILLSPSIKYRVTGDSQSTVRALTYEYGDTVTLQWEIEFNPGKYSYGTKKENDSDLYIDKIEFLNGTGSYHKTRISREFTDFAKYPQPNRGPYTISGTFDIALDHAPTELEEYVPYTSMGKSIIKVIGIDDTADYAVSSFGDSAANINFSSYTEESSALKASAGEVFGAYRWFVGYRTAPEDNLTFTENDSIDRDLFKDKESSLDGLPETITTTSAKQWFFAVPKVANIAKIELENLRTGAAVSTNDWQTTQVKIADASGKQLNNYTLFSVTNPVADLGTNTYKINVTLGGGTDE